MTRVLFVCSRNRLRSPTAERIFTGRPDIEVASAGTAPDADEPLTGELLEWAEIVFVMEKAHRAILNRRFRSATRHGRVICLDIPDRYAFMDPALVAILERKVEPHLRRR